MKKTAILITTLASLTLALDFIPHTPVVTTDGTTINSQGEHIEDND